MLESQNLEESIENMSVERISSLVDILQHDNYNNTENVETKFKGK